MTTIRELRRSELQSLVERVEGAQELERAPGIGQRTLMGCHSTLDAPRPRRLTT